ncbi:MAG: hypothetical protein V1904_00620 [Bacteroidota bacterium]
MKKTFRYLFTLASLTCFLVSCDPDDNNPPDDTDPRDKFVGSWSCNENSSQNGISTFTVTISLNTGNSTQIYLSNFYGLTSNQVYAVIAGNSATIPSQTVSTFTINGSGTMSSANTKIDWSYNVNDGADIDNCTAVFSK